MRGKLARLGLAVGIVALLFGGLAAADRRPLRVAEEAYLDGREVTACATRELRPFAESARSMDELPEALESLIVEARAEARKVRARSEELSVGILPPTRSAVGAVQDALDAQVALYDAMADDPQGTEDELAALGPAYASAEQRLRSARSWLMAGEPGRWDHRLECRRRV